MYALQIKNNLANPHFIYPGQVLMIPVRSRRFKSTRGAVTSASLCDRTMTEKLIDRQYLYRGKIVNLRLDHLRLPNRKTGLCEVVEHHGAVAIIALDEKNRVLMVRQYRAGARRELSEIPAGTLEPKEPPLACAKRELHEETGMRARRWKSLGYFYSTPGFCTEKMYLFLARGLGLGQAAPDDDEFIHAEWMPLVRVLRLIERGAISDAKTIAGLLRVARLLKL